MVRSFSPSLPIPEQLKFITSPSFPPLLKNRVYSSVLQAGTRNSKPYEGVRDEVTRPLSTSTTAISVKVTLTSILRENFNETRTGGSQVRWARGPLET